MDIENLVYVVLAIIYILSRVMKARKKKQMSDTTDEAESNTESQVTFEDMLKEFGGRQSQQPEEVPEPVVEKEVVDSREILSHDEKKSIFQKPIDEAASYSMKKEKSEEKGLSIIPTRLYINPKGLAKIEIVLAKGKKLHDKRDSLKEKDIKREIEQSSY